MGDAADVFGSTTPHEPHARDVSASPVERRGTPIRTAPIIIAALLFFSLATILAGTAQGRPAHEKRTARLREALTRSVPAEGIRVNIQLRELEGVTRQNRRTKVRQRQAAVLGRLPGRGFQLGHRYGALNGLSGWASPEAIEAMAADPDVLSIDVDRKATVSLYEGRPLLGVDQVQSWGIDGTGVGVAVIDTGIDTDHPDLPTAAAQVCYCDDDANPFTGCCPNGNANQTTGNAAEDDGRHGTSMSGIIASQLSGRLGVAHGADLVAIKTFNENGVGNFSDIAAGLDWVINNAATYGIKVVNLSSGDTGEYDDDSVSPCVNTLTANAIATLHGMDIAVFAATGNLGHDAGIAFPACVAEAIAVGGSYDAPQSLVEWCGDPACDPPTCVDPHPTLTDQFACVSNDGSLVDMLAPARKNHTTNMGGNSTFANGTSASSAYAAGLAALLYQVDGTLQVEEIRSLLTMDSPLVLNPDNGQYRPRARIDRAIASLNVLCGDAFVDPGEQCDDGNLADGDCCDASCQFEALGSSCDDGDACTAPDTCDGAGSCDGEAPIVCDDSEICTDDACDPQTGCTFTPNSVPCDDGDACTGPDVCAGGVCNTPTLDCNDSDPCTNDLCDSGTGCYHVNNSALCDDGSVCTVPDVCNDGVCEGLSTINCDDSNPCTDDLCDAVSGCYNPFNTLSCDDGSACTSADTCNAGACVGSSIDCDDANACTIDGCDAQAGCTHFYINGCTLEQPPLGTPGLSFWGGLVCSAGLIFAAIQILNGSPASSRRHGG